MPFLGDALTVGFHFCSKDVAVPAHRHVRRRRRVGGAAGLAQGHGPAGGRPRGVRQPVGRPRRRVRVGVDRGRRLHAAGGGQGPAHGVLPHPRRGRRARPHLGLDHARAVADLPLRDRQAHRPGVAGRRGRGAVLLRVRGDLGRAQAGRLQGRPDDARGHAARRRRARTPTGPSTAARSPRSRPEEEDRWPPPCWRRPCRTRSPTTRRSTSPCSSRTSWSTARRRHARRLPGRRRLGRRRSPAARSRCRPRWAGHDLPLRVVSSPDAASWAAVLPPGHAVDGFPAPALSAADVADQPGAPDERPRRRPAPRGDHGGADPPAGPRRRPGGRRAAGTLADLDQDGPLCRLLDDAPEPGPPGPAGRRRPAARRADHDRPAHRAGRTRPRARPRQEIPPLPPYQSEIVDQPVARSRCCSTTPTPTRA